MTLDPVVSVFALLALAVWGGRTVSLGFDNGALRPLVLPFDLHPHPRAVEGRPGGDGSPPSDDGQVSAGRRSGFRGRCLVDPAQDGGYGKA